MREAAPVPFRFETLALHAGYAPEGETRSRAVPIYQTASHVFDDTGQGARLFGLQEPGYLYARLGNPTVAVLEAMRRATERARSGKGGSVIEFLTYRLHDHTTADDARRYRDDAEVKAAWEREPMTRLRTWLTAQGAWSEAEEAAWKQECDRLVNIEVDAYLATPVQPVEAMFDYLYADPPPELLAQRAAAVALEQRHG